MCGSRSRRLILAGGLIGLGALAISRGFGFDKLGQLTEVGVDFVEVLAGWQQQVARGKSKLPGFVAARTPGSTCWCRSPVRLAYFLGAPFAWMVGGVKRSVGGSSTGRSC